MGEQYVAVSGDLMTGTLNLPDEILTAIDKTITATTVDVFVYDAPTSDDDGGAWLSKYSHELNLTNLMVLVATATELTLYNAADSTLPVLKVFTVGANNIVFAAPTAITALNGRLGVATGSGFVEINLITDRATKFTTGDDEVYNGTLNTTGNGWN